MAAASALVLTAAARPYYQPGAHYTLTVSLNHPEVRRAGFQLTARLMDRGSDEAGATPAGRLAARGDEVMIVQAGDPAVQYAQHTEAGSHLEMPGHARWTVEWRAPTDHSGHVVFHLVGNAANDDDSEFGDFIYTDSLVIGNSGIEEPGVLGSTAENPWHRAPERSTSRRTRAGRAPARSRS